MAAAGKVQQVDKRTFMAEAAERRTIGVSSSVSLAKSSRSSVFTRSSIHHAIPAKQELWLSESFILGWLAILSLPVSLEYALAKRPQPEVRAVNQSPVANRLMRGTKWSTKSASGSTSATLQRDSTDCCWCTEHVCE